MLDFTTRMVFNPGSNLKDQLAGANWSFLLPVMKLKSILCFGTPSLRSQETLSQLSREVFIITEDPHLLLFQPREQDYRIVLTHMQSNVNSIPACASNGTVDLVFINGRKMIRKFYSNPGLRTELRRLLSPRGLIYLALDSLFDRLTTQKKAVQLADNLGISHFFWLTPCLGEIHTAVPVDDQITINYFIRHRLYQSESRTNILARSRRIIQELLIKDKFTRRQSILISQENNFEMRMPPEYLRTLASQAGINIERHRWGLVAHGEYSTRKVLFYLFRPDDESPEYIIKLVRNSALNFRLENEYHALSALWNKNLGELRFFPEPMFFGYHNDLAILGEKVIAGKSFQQMTRNHPDFSYARLAVQHLTALGVATANPYSALPGQAAETLKQLFVSFIRIYNPNPKVQIFLKKQIDTIACHQGAFPLVFQHGDPGTWNIFVTSKGEVFFLDWESAEANGVPLWDLFYFLRSYAVGLARKAGIRKAIKGFEKMFLSDNPFSHFAIEALHDYCQKLKMPAELVEPLFYTCWMHRSLKEANRLGLNQIPKSHYFNLLLFCIQNRDAPQISRLFDAGC